MELRERTHEYFCRRIAESEAELDAARRAADAAKKEAAEHSERNKRLQAQLEAACKEATTALSELESARALKESHAKISIDRFKQVESLREELEMAQARIEMARRRELKLKASAQTGKHI